MPFGAWGFDSLSRHLTMSSETFVDTPSSIERLTPRFSMHRAVAEYVERYYLAAHRSRA
ncbi:MAG: hypothetical protein WD689_10390 [Gaiellaceae bacterium]